MNEIFVKSSVSIIKLISSKEIMNKIINDEFLGAYIPSVKILSESNIYDAEIKIINSNKNKLNIKYPKVTYEFKELNTKDIISVIEYIFERSRSEKGVICIHGVAAILNNKAVICMGTTTGMGKTTLALELSKNNLFYSDEKVLIDLNKLKVVGRIKSQYISNDYWKSLYGDKKYFKNNNISEKKEYDIGLFIEPIICASNDYNIDVWNKDKFLWHIYEESSRKIRGTSRVIFNKTYPVKSLDTEKLSIKRLQLLKELVSKKEAIYYKGNKDEIIKYVINYLN